MGPNSLSMTFIDLVLFLPVFKGFCLYPTTASTELHWPDSDLCWSWSDVAESQVERGWGARWTPADPGSGPVAICGPESGHCNGTGSWWPPAHSESSHYWLSSSQGSRLSADAASVSASCLGKTQPSPRCLLSLALSQAAAWETLDPVEILAAQCLCWSGLCAVSPLLAFSAYEQESGVL